MSDVIINVTVSEGGIIDADLSSATVVNVEVDPAPEVISTVTGGAKGDKGDTGNTGATGATGPQGPQGNTGNTGAAATIEVGDVTTVDPSDPASVTNVGTSGAAIFDFDIPQGEQGDQGIQGIQGIQGNPGTNGSTWFSGSGAPGGGTGVNGDYYFRTSNGDVYLKSAGTWSVVANITGPTGATGATGSTGAAGADGKTVLSGTAAPTTEGVDGDFYIRTSTNFIYGPKASGVWPSGVSLIGPTGATGAPGADGVVQSIVAGSGISVDDTDPANPEISTSGAVTSVNGDTGDVVLNQDDVLDGTTYKQYSATEKTKLAGIETGADVTDAANVDAAGATMNADTTLAGNGYFLDEDNMASDSAIKVPSQQSVKAYADTKQPLDSDLTTIAGLTATTDNIIQSKSSAWASRTLAQFIADLAALGTTFQPLDADLTTIAGLTATTDNFLVAVSSAWASRTPAQVRTTLALVIGTNIQAWDADLDAIAALGVTNDSIIQGKGGVWAKRTIAQLLTDLAAAGTTFQPLDSDLTTIAGLTATTDNFMVGTSSAWASRTPTQARSQMGLGALAVLATVGTAQIDANAVSAVLLDVTESTDFQNGTSLTANTWTDFKGNQNFTVTTSGSIILVNIRGAALVGGVASLIAAGMRIVIDSAGTPVTRYVSGCYVPVNSQYGNPLAGVNSVAITGLAPGVHTIKTQILSNTTNSLVYCRTSSIPNLEFFSTQIIELKK